MAAKMAPHLLFGFAVAGLLHVLIRKEFFQRWLGKPVLSSVVNASVLGVPIPLCSFSVIPVAVSLRKSGASKGATASIPIANALLAAGLSPGAALVFLIAGPATNTTTITAAWKMLGRGATAIYLVSLLSISW